MKEIPALTVVIPAYNSATTIARAVQSCDPLAGCRVLVVDDGSTDATAATAIEAGAEVIYQANAGASHARRNGIAHSTTEYVALLDADDELLPAGVARSIEMLEADPELSVVGGRVIGLAPNGAERLLTRNYKEITTEGLLRTGFGPWPPAAAVVRRSALQLAEELSVPSLNTRFAEDFELVIRLSVVGKVGMHDEPSTLYRLYGGKSSSAPVAAIRDKEAIRRHYAQNLGISAILMSSAHIKGAAYTRAARAAWANGRKGRALLWVVRAVMSAPGLIFGKLQNRMASGSIGR